MKDSSEKETDPTKQGGSPLFEAKQFDESSVFTPDTLLKEARRQKDLPDSEAPNVCVLDPDGDIVRYLISTGRAEKEERWPGYHTDLYRFSLDGNEVGIIGCVVGGPFAVLVAEQLFASGCQFLVSVTSSGQIVSKDNPPYFVLIEKALRDEGTSHHYMAPNRYAALPTDIQEKVKTACKSTSHPVYTGATWTTDAPFRETEVAIERAQNEGILAVEMEAAALYTFAKKQGYPIVCFAFVTNKMGEGDSEFEKGNTKGSLAALEIIKTTIKAWKSNP